MAKLTLTFWLLAYMASTSAAFRTKIADTLNAPQHFDVDAEPAAKFLEELRSHGPAGEAAATLIANLEDGMDGTEAPADVFLDVDTQVPPEYVLTVRHAQPLQGQIATPSKVPVRWAVKQEVKWFYRDSGSDAPLNLRVQGLMLLPFSEGKEMYEASGVAEACNGHAGNILAMVQCERRAFWDFYTAAYKTTYKQKSYLNYAENPDHKLGRILMGMYGSSKNYYAIRAKGLDGWQQVLYSLVTIPPVEVGDFTFTPKGSSAGSVEMAMTQNELTEGSFFGFDFGAYAGLEFAAKNAGEFDASAFEWQRTAGEMFARSGLNFGAMVAKGRDPSIRGGTAEYILKFARNCENPSADKTYGDITDGCRGDDGRVVWSA